MISFQVRTLLLLTCICSVVISYRAQAFMASTPPPTRINFHIIRHRYDYASSLSSRRTLLFSSPVDRPPPRRTLKKRKNKRRQRINKLSQNDMLRSNYHSKNNNNKSSDVEIIEIRPIRRRDAVEKGLDYWIDDNDLQQFEKAKRIAYKNRIKSMEVGGSISKEKLKEEVVAPYKQNWIGLFSVVITALSMIGRQFPELLQNPIIPIPDL